jgi:hypothetical protein
MTVKPAAVTSSAVYLPKSTSALITGLPSRSCGCQKIGYH